MTHLKYTDYVAHYTKFFNMRDSIQGLFFDLEDAKEECLQHLIETPDVIGVRIVELRRDKEPYREWEYDHETESWIETLTDPNE